MRDRDGLHPRKHPGGSRYPTTRDGAPDPLPPEEATRDARIREAIEAWAARDIAYGAEPYRARDLLASIWTMLGGEGRLFAHVGAKMAASDSS